MRNKENFIKYLKLAIIGYLMGVANVIPGVSGGTIAFVSGIYEELISGIRKIASADSIKKLLEFRLKELFSSLPLAFLASIGFGTLLAFATFAKSVTWLLDNYQVHTYAAFLGMIAGSVFIVAKMIKTWKFSAFAALAAGIVSAYFIVNLLPYETPNKWWLSFFCGAIAIIAMILPGISGSFLLLILGQYKYVWGAISRLSRFQFSLADISTCFWIGLGGAIGLGAFSHLLNWLFRKYHDLTVSLLTGFMIGSLWRLWPWQTTTLYSAKIANEILEIEASPENLQKLEELKNSGAEIRALVQENFLPEQFDSSVMLAVILMAAGCLSVIILEKKKNKAGDKNGNKTA